jgi:hypothetical protein
MRHRSQISKPPQETLIYQKVRGPANRRASTFPPCWADNQTMANSKFQLREFTYARYLYKGVFGALMLLAIVVTFGIKRTSVSDRVVPLTNATPAAAQLQPDLAANGLTASAR